MAFAIVAYQQSGSPFIVAMLSMLRMLPMGLCGPLLATFADRVQRRTVFLAAIGLNLAMATGLMLLSASGRLAIWHLAVAAFVNGLNTVTFDAEGHTEWRSVAAAATVHIAGGTAWYVYDAGLNVLSSGASLPADVQAQLAGASEKGIKVADRLEWLAAEYGAHLTRTDLEAHARHGT